MKRKLLDISILNWTDFEDKPVQDVMDRIEDIIGMSIGYQNLSGPFVDTVSANGQKVCIWECGTYVTWDDYISEMTSVVTPLLPGAMVMVRFSDKATADHEIAYFQDGKYCRKDCTEPEISDVAKYAEPDIPVWNVPGEHLEEEK